MIIRRDDSLARALAPFALAGSGGRAPEPGRDGDRLPVLELDKPAETGSEASGEADPGASLSGALVERIARLEEDLARERAARDAAVAAATREGFENGRREAGDEAAAKLAALRDGIAEAVERCAATLAGSGDQAVAIARAALRAILGEATARAAMVDEAVRNAVAQVARGRLLGVRVSAEDFPDEAALATLAQAIGGVSIARDDKLAGGDCLLDLTLGTLDASLAVQAAAADLALSRFEPGAAEARR